MADLAVLATREGSARPARGRERPLRKATLGLGSSYLFAILALGPLLGSTADASSAFTEHFADDGNRVLDLLGGVALLVAAGMLGWTVVAARSAAARSAAANTSSTLRDLTVMSGTITSASLVVAAGMLLTVPLTTSLGDLTGDPGIDQGVQAGIAQAGTVVLLAAALCLGATAVLLARVARQAGAVPRWINVTAWVTAATLLLGISVALLLPFVAWVVAFGNAWRSEPR